MTIPLQDPAALEAYCLPFIRGEKRPATAAELMASRYVAYTIKAIDYLLETHDPKSRKDTDRKSTEEWAQNATFHGLDIRSTEQGGPDDDVGQVEFVTKYTMDGSEHVHHERSRFRRVDGRWYFSAGQKVGAQPLRNEGPKVGRNDPCPCGSGKKHKKCCGAAA
jgi:SEC-C motif-containing protein